MKHAARVAVLAFVSLVVVDVTASGQAGIYAIVERVVLEPAANPERIQVWGAFAIIERTIGSVSRDPGQSSLPWTAVDGQYFTNYLYQQPARGYLYFKLPPAPADIEKARREWNDLAAVAGTNQAIAFGYWDRFRGDPLLRVRDGATKPDAPDIYYTDVGIAKLPPNGSHAGSSPISGVFYRDEVRNAPSPSRRLGGGEASASGKPASSVTPRA